MSVRDKRPVKIAVDAMSGDRGPDVVVRAVSQALRRHPDLEVALTGQPDSLEGSLRESCDGMSARLSVHPASEIVGMAETPRDALRKKKDSSMRRALELVRDGHAQACVSAGNTGALVATSRYLLKTMPGIDRPAIVSTIPARGGHTCMLDLGANTDCTPEQLMQFGLMGSVIAEDVFELARPRIGLLNIGGEQIKGTETIRAASELLRRTGLNYIGFVEGHDIFSGQVDVVVADGFTGNVALKTIEGAYAEVLNVVVEEFSRGPARRAMAFTSKPIVNALRERLDPRRHNGASLVGLRGIVIKSHGNADEIALGNALDLAVLESRNGVPTQIGERLAQMMSDREAS